MQGCRHVGNSDAAPKGEHGNHGHHGLAAAAQHTRRAMGKGKQEKEQANDPCMAHADGDGCLRLYEKVK